MIANGIDRIGRYDQKLKGKRLGLLTSISGVDCQLTSSIDILRKHYQVTALFGPEHGVRGEAGAGDFVDSSTDRISGLPIYSLYRKDSKRFTKEMLSEVDAVVYDIQDVGVRFYTFISTMLHAMEDCAACRKEFIVLDRMNVLGGKVEGNILDKAYESFVGVAPICMRYGLTAGELAKMFLAMYQLDLELTVIPCEGWHRDMLFPDTKNVWVMPSLGLPRFETALLYSGTCLFEGTNVSEGRGTAAPFEIIGAPFIRADRLTRYMNNKQLPGVIFSPVFFTPTTSKHQGQPCEGVHIHVTEAKAVKAVETGLTLIFAIKELWPESFSYLPPAAEGRKQFIELLFGNNKLLDPTVTLEALLSDYEKDSRMFLDRSRDYWLYE